MGGENWSECLAFETEKAVPASSTVILLTAVLAQARSLQSPLSYFLTIDGHSSIKRCACASLHGSLRLCEAVALE